MARSRVVGLDIGTSAVRAAEIAFGAGGPSGTAQPTLQRYGQVPLPVGAVQEGEVAEPETVATAIRQLWREQRFSTKDVVLGVGSQRVIVRELELPWAPMPQLRASLPYQVQDMLPMAADDALLDYFPSGEHSGVAGRTLQGLLVAASRETVRVNVMAAETAGLRPQMVDLNAFALLRSVARGEHAQTVVALVDIGARMTNVVIVANGVPRFTRTLASGGQDVTDALAGHLGLPVPEAERLKREIGVGYPVSPDLAAGAAAVADVTRSVVESIRNTFVYYSGNNPGARIELAVLTGGGVHLPGLGQYLATESRLPISFGDPLAGLKVSAAAQEQLPESSSLVALPVGLAYGVAA